MIHPGRTGRLEPKVLNDGIGGNPEVPADAVTSEAEVLIELIVRRPLGAELRDVRRRRVVPGVEQRVARRVRGDVSRRVEGRVIRYP
jgi:hypothetical protein